MVTKLLPPLLVLLHFTLTVSWLREKNDVVPYFLFLKDKVFIRDTGFIVREIVRITDNDNTERVFRDTTSGCHAYIICIV